MSEKIEVDTLRNVLNQINFPSIECPYCSNEMFVGVDEDEGKKVLVYFCDCEDWKLAEQALEIALLETKEPGKLPGTVRHHLIEESRDGEGQDC